MWIGVRGHIGIYRGYIGGLTPDIWEYIGNITPDIWEYIGNIWKIYRNVWKIYRSVENVENCVLDGLRWAATTPTPPDGLRWAATDLRLSSEQHPLGKTPHRSAIGLP